MEKAGGEINLGRRLAGRLFPLALVVGFLLSLGLPATYYVLEFNALGRAATIDARRLSERLRGLMLDAPALQILREFVPYKAVTIIRVLDEAGRPIIGYEHKTAAAGAWWNRYAPRGSAPLVFNNRQVGTIEVGASQSALLRVTLGLLLLSTAAGASLAFWIYRFPVRVVTRMEEEQERLRAAVRVSERRFESLVQDLDAVVWEADAATWQFSFVSQRAEAILGYPVERWLKEPTFWQDHIHPDDRERAVAFCQAATSEGKDHQFEYRALTADGRAVWVRDIVRVVREPDGPARRLRGVMLDITALKETQKALVDRTRRLEAVRAVTEEITRELSLGTLLELINRRAAELAGAASGAVYLWDEAARVLVPHVWHGLGKWMEDVRLELGEGIAGTVAQRRQGMMVNDYRTSPTASPLFLERTAITACLAEPLLYRDRLLGAITLNNEETGRPFTEQNREILALFADHAAIAIENARLFDAREKAQRVLEQLYAVGISLHASRELGDRIENFVRGAREVVGFDRLNVLLLSPDGSALELVVSAEGEILPPHIRVPVDSAGPFAEALHTGRALLIQGKEDLEAFPRFDPALSNLPIFRSTRFVVVPLVAGDEVIGVVGADNKRSRRPITTTSVGQLQLFCQQLAVAIDNARLYEMTLHRAHQLATLNDLARTLTTVLDPQAVGREILAAVQTLIPGSAGRLWERMADDDALCLVASVGLRDPEGGATLRLRPGEGLTGLAATTRQPVTSRDVVRDPRFINKAWAAAEGLVSGIIVPLIHGERLTGSLAIFTRAPHDFTDEELDLLRALAAQGAIALENARLFQQEQARRQEAVTLLEIARSTSSTLEQRELFKIIAQGAARACRVDRCSIFLWDEPRGRVIPVMSQFADGTADPWMWAAFKTLGELRIEAVPFFLEVVRRREPLQITDPGSDPLIPPGWIDLFQIKASLDVPLIYQDRALGVLVLDYVREAHAFTPEQVRLAVTLAGQVTLAMENARLVKDLRQALDDLKAVQDQLVRGATLRAVGELASGMAHHLNNLLAIVLGRIELLLQKVREPEVRRALESAGRAARDGAEVVRRLRGFSLMRPVSEMVQVDLNQIASEVLELLRPLWQYQAQLRGVEIQVSLEPGQIPAVAGEPASLREVTINLLLNAIDALPEGGRITVKTWASDQGVYCSVTDTGVGMSEEVRRRVLEPFFTTKGPKSTGLGLSVSYGIVQRHGGELALESAPGRGTTVTIRLPLVQAAPAT